MSDTIDDGGPAFPVLTDRSGGEEFYLGTPGMSLRAYMATKFMAAILSDSATAANISKASREDGVSPSKFAAAAAVGYADALIAELAKGGAQ